MRYRRFVYVGFLIIAAGFPFIFIGCGGGGMSVPDLAPKKTGLSSNMLGLAMNDFFQKLKEGRKDFEYFDNALRRKEWNKVSTWSYMAYQDYGMALYNYSAFKDGSPIDRPGYNEMAAKIARVGKSALPEMISAIQYTAMLKNTSFHKLKADELAIIYQRYVYHITKPFVEYPIDPLQELKTRKLAAEGLWDFYNIHKKGMSKGDRESQERLISYIGPYPYEMLTRECRWLLSFVHDHDLPEACSIVMEVESRLPEIERIAEEVWEKVGGRKGAAKLNKRLLKKDRFHKLEYMLTRHSERDKKNLQYFSKKTQKFYSDFEMEREKLKNKFGYAEWANKLLNKLSRKSFNLSELVKNFQHTLHHVPQLIWASPVRVRRIRRGVITLRTFRWTSITLTLCWAEDRSLAQKYMIDYLTRPSLMRGEEIKKSTGEIGDACYYKRIDMYGKKDSIAYLNFIRDNIVVLIKGVGMSAERCLKFSQAIDTFIQDQPEFKPENDVYKDWFAKIKNIDLSVKVTSSIPINLPPVPRENLKPFCLDLDTHGYIMEKEGKFTYHGWEPGQGEIAVGLINKDGGEILRYEKIRVEVK